MKIIIANWKMNPNSFEDARKLFAETIELSAQYKDVLTVISPPFPYLQDCSAVLSLRDIPNATLGAQDMFWESEGAFTGEVSPRMLRDLHVDYVMIGHSDRRYVMGEGDEMINKKLKAALENLMIPILIVGEREQGEAQEDVFVDQLSRDLEGLTKSDLGKMMIAYEPVWAISTTKDAKSETPEGALQAIRLIKNILIKMFNLKQDDPLLPIMLYGGSLNSKNIKSFLGNVEIGGAVVGSASLRPDELKSMFGKISQAKSIIEEEGDDSGDIQ